MIKILLFQRSQVPFPASMAGSPRPPPALLDLTHSCNLCEYLHAHGMRMHSEITVKALSWNDGSAVKNGCCPSRQPKFHSQHPCWQVHNHMQLHSRSSTLSSSLWALTRMVHTHTRTHTNKQTQNPFKTFKGQSEKYPSTLQMKILLKMKYLFQGHKDIK